VSGDTVIYLVTEPVSPLPTLLEALELDADQRVMYLALGLRQAAQAVAFLNNQCKMMHGNICMRTLLATPELDWKLGFFDMVSEHAHLTSSLLARCVSSPCPLQLFNERVWIFSGLPYTYTIMQLL
jgi:hypothetical protein